MDVSDHAVSDTFDSFLNDVTSPPTSTLIGAIDFWKQSKGDTRKVCDAAFPFIFGKMNVTWPMRHVSLFVCIPTSISELLNDKSILFSHIGFVYNVETLRDLHFVSLQGTVHRIVYENDKIVSIGGHEVYDSERFKGGYVFSITDKLSTFVSITRKNAQGEVVGFQGKVPLSHEYNELHPKYVCMTIHTFNTVYFVSPMKLSERAWKIQLYRKYGPRTRFFIHLCDLSKKVCIASSELNLRYVPMDDCVQTPMMNDSRLIIPEITLTRSLMEIFNRVRDLNSFLDYDRMTVAERVHVSKSLCENVRTNGWTPLHFFAAVPSSSSTLSIFLSKLGKVVNVRHIDNDFCTPLMISMRYDNPMCFVRLLHWESKMHLSYKKMWTIVEERVFSH